MRAWRWQRMLDEGKLASVAEIADKKRINRSSVSRILRVTVLVPDVVERIMDGQNLPGPTELLKPFSVGSEEQRADLFRLRTTPDTKAG